jgi:murein DD-endopeptidase MepM/ murein hydrolase activator NlpD
MNPPFTLLVVHGDGTQVMRLRVPRWVAYGGLGMMTATLAVAVGLSGERAVLVQQARQVAALERDVAEKRDVIDAFQTRVAAVRTEIAGWGQLHARMWDALGPAAGSGVGGPRSEPPPEPADAGPLGELDLLADAVAAEGPRLQDLERVISRTGEIMSALPLQWPVRGPIRSGFGRRPSPWSGKPERHDGIDIGLAPGTPVTSPAAGVALVAGGGGDLGTHVQLDHGHGVRSIYGHLRKVEVKKGQRVEKGQVVGLVGSTGRSTGPHLHYEVRVGGRAVDPREMMWEP